ncbi:MAG: hypothetical protein JSW53_02130, partial [Candidatus Bathyarchaeota archaeon]
MARLFFLLSGEHPTLPFSELRAILEAQDHGFRIVQKLIQVLRVETEIESVESVKTRAAMVRICGLELFSCSATITRILEKARSTSFEDLLKEGESYAVRVYRIRGSAPKTERLRLER